jgi:hypothetical protein
MRAIVVTITKEQWPAQLSRHWHLVDSYLSRHVIGAVHAVYGKMALIEEMEWDESAGPPPCPQCHQPIR